MIGPGDEDDLMAAGGDEVHAATLSPISAETIVLMVRRISSLRVCNGRRPG